MTKVFWSALASLCLASSALAQSPQDIATLQHQLDAQFVPTKASSDKSNVVTAGSIVTLKKDGLMTYIGTVGTPPVSTYKNGKLAVGFGDALGVDLLDGMTFPGGANAIPRKTLVTGEKAWLIETKVQKDKVFFVLLTEPYDDGRYIGAIKIQFPKGKLPSSQEIAAMVSEVATIDPPAPPDAAAQSQPQAVAAPPPPPMADIPPPPPPTDQAPPATKTISLGQTKAEVTTAFGQPQKVVRLGAKEIDYYPDMKVTFVAGKVSDVQ